MIECRRCDVYSNDDNKRRSLLGIRSYRRLKTEDSSLLIAGRPDTLSQKAYGVHRHRPWHQWTTVYRMFSERDLQENQRPEEDN